MQQVVDSAPGSSTTTSTLLKGTPGNVGTSTAAAATAKAEKLFSCLLYRAPTTPATFTSSVFKPENVKCGGKSETVLVGGRHLFPLLPKGFRGVKTIGVVGWGSQGPAQAQNLRDSLRGTDITVKVGLRVDSKSREEAERCGFKTADKTLGEIEEIVREADLTVLLISDAACTVEYEKIFAAMRPNTYLGLSHGFLLGYLQAKGKKFPDHIGVIAVCPKGVGPSVRRLYEQGESVNGAGINSSFAVHQDLEDKRGTDIALAWSVAIGSPYTFQTTLEAEYKSDIFGERGILLGAVHGICEVLYRHFVMTRGFSKEDAYLTVVEGIVRPISKLISHEGILAVYNKFSGDEDKKLFEKAYAAAYDPALEILSTIYDEVASGREILSVVDDCRRHAAGFPFEKIDESPLWKVGAEVRERGISDENVPLDPTVAGFYIAAMVAQCDLLRAAGHSESEIANESVIEATDSLNPFLRHKGVSYMVDNCSTTARLGSRKWAPRFDYIFDQQALPVLVGGSTKQSPARIERAIEAFRTNPIHEALAVFGKMRPSVDIVLF